MAMHPRKRIHADRETYLVERILQRKTFREASGNVERCLVKWLGFPDEENTWEPIENVKHILDEDRADRDRERRVKRREQGRGRQCEGGGNDYEAQRAKRMAENQMKLKNIGVQSTVSLISETKMNFRSGIRPAVRKMLYFDAEGGSGAHCKRIVLNTNRRAPSRRLRGKPAECLGKVAGETGIADRPKEQPAEQKTLYTKQGRPRMQLVLPNHRIEAPFTLLSIGVTVWDTGKIHRGKWANNYWSSTGCLYHHAYPVGYRATKTHFDRDYEMRIEGSERAPVFVVKDIGSGQTFRGLSPTKPWTQVCLSKRVGTRISGPQFFGFSDPVTQSAICSMYNAREMTAALDGSRAWAEVMSTQEKAAKDFMRVDGIGEATAITLATTTCLGGYKHKGIRSLAKWARQGTNEDALVKFLSESEEISRGLRKWPAWTIRCVPNIVNKLVHGGKW